MATPTTTQPPPNTTQWITTPLQSGHLSNSAYDCTISGLNPNTLYEYRSYMIVDGISYCGDVKQIATLPIITNIPVICTGGISIITSNKMRTCGNIVTDDGNLPIDEYGVLYTQNSTYGTIPNLIYNNYPSLVCKKSISSDIGNNIPFFVGSTCEIHGLSPNTTTYYRAFAMNSHGLGYGKIETVQTCTLGFRPITLCLYETFSSCVNSSVGVIGTSAPLLINESITMSIKMFDSIITSGDANAKIYCKPSGSGTYSQIYDCTLSVVVETATPTENTEYKSITMNCGDSLCWEHRNGGDNGSCSTIEIDDITGTSSGISSTISTTYYCDRVFV